MPRKKNLCPTCGQPKSAEAEQCRKCKPSYVRTPEQNQHLSEVLQGKPKEWLRGRSRPSHSQLMKDWWTDERRQAKRVEMMARNPSARYHGLSAKGAKRLCEALGHCELCGHDGSESRLDVHHKNRDKHDQSLENLIVLCHRCHMAVHAEVGETGWDSYWKKRKSNQD